MVESKLDMSTGSTGKAEEKRLTGLLVKALIQRWKIDDDLANRILNDADLQQKGAYYDRVAIIKGLILPEKVTKAQLELLQKAPSNSTKGKPDYKNISTTLTFSGIIPQIEDLKKELQLQEEQTPKQIEAEKLQAEKDKAKKAEEKTKKAEEKKQKEEAKIKEKVVKLDEAQEKQRISEQNARIADAKKQAEIEQKQKIAEAEETLKKSQQKALIENAKKQAEIVEKQKIQQEMEQAVQIQQTIELPEEIKESEFAPEESVFQQSMVQSRIPRTQPDEGRLFGRLQKDPNRITSGASFRMSRFASDDFVSAEGSTGNIVDDAERQQFNQQLDKQQQIELKPVQEVKPKRTGFFSDLTANLYSGFGKIGQELSSGIKTGGQLGFEVAREQFKKQFAKQPEESKIATVDPVPRINNDRSAFEDEDLEPAIAEQIDTTLNNYNKQEMEQSDADSVSQMIQGSKGSKNNNRSRIEESALMQTFIEADLMRQPTFVKEGALYVMSFGNLDQKKKLAQELKNLDQMTGDEKIAFDKKMKKFSNVAKLADSTDKIKVQLLLDKRRQLLEAQLVKKTKPKATD